MKRKRVMLVFLMICCCGIGFGGVRWLLPRHTQIKMGDHYIEVNPQAQLDPQHSYTIQLWDYNYPGGEARFDYRKYLEKAVAAFQKGYPNVKVEITLLDIAAGPARLAQALQSNEGPDVYGSAYQIPAFDYRNQIPVGFFLTPEERAEYFPALQSLVTVDQCLYAFPRWTAPGLWIGNRELLEKAGLAVDRIRIEGWNWQQLIELGGALPAGRSLLAANPSANGFFRQLAANAEPSAGHKVPIWNGQSAGAALDLLAELTEAPRQAAVVCNDFLSRFQKGRAAILAGVRPVFLPLLRRKLAAGHPEGLVFLPVPCRITTQNTIPAENGVLCVYRNKRSSEAQITAAVKLARFLSCYQETDPWVNLMVIPASTAAAAEWARKTARLLPPAEAAYLVQTAQDPHIRNLPDWPEYQNNIYPVLLDFLAGNLEPSQAQAQMFEIR